LQSQEFVACFLERVIRFCVTAIIKHVINNSDIKRRHAKNENSNNTAMIFNSTTIDDYSRDGPLNSNSVLYRPYTAFTL
jgi:hypothetical protein